jgi:single-strand DNA-binding protein
MVAFNSVVLAGNLTRDPELRYLATGTALCEIRLAVSRVWKGKDGQRHEDVCFIDVTFWNRTAEVAAQYLKKGKPVLVHGNLEYDQWVDKKTNEKRSKHKIRGNALQFLGEGRGARDPGNGRDGARPAPAPPEGVEDEAEDEAATVGTDEKEPF